MSVLRVAARTAVAIVSVGALVATGVGWSLQRSVTASIVTSNALTSGPGVAAPPVAPGQAFTALLVGLDARTDAGGNPLPRATLDALHVGPDDGQLNTDTMILLHVPADADSPAVAISIPRDSYVPISGGGTHKINSAYGRAFGEREKILGAQGITGAALDQESREAGRSALVATVQSLTGLPIDHYAEINFAGFVDLTEALGGVPVCLNKAVSDSYSGIDLPAGPQTVNGAAALAFVRQRHGLDGGDLDRVARQQAFIAGLTQRLRSNGTLTDPAKLGQLVNVASRYVVIDQGWDLDQALTQVGRLAGDDLTFRTIPTGRPDLRTPSDGVAVQIDRAGVQAFVDQQFFGTPSTSTPGTSTPSTSTPSTAGVEPAGTPVATSAPTTSAPRVITADGVPCVN